MATLNVTGLAELTMDLDELENLPDSVIEEMLQAEGEIIKKAQEFTAAKMLQGPYYAGGVASAVEVGKMKKSRGNRVLYVTYKGTQHGNRVAEIAFVNEFGKRSQDPRPFIRVANEENAEVAVDAAAKIYDQYLTQKGF